RVLPTSPTPRLDVRLLDDPPIDGEHVPLVRHRVPRKPDQALHERAARVTRRLGRRRGRVEDDDLPPVRTTEVVDEAVREHAVRKARLTASPWTGAVESR